MGPPWHPNRPCAAHALQKRTLRRDFREQRDSQWKEKRQRTADGWASPELKNEAFDEYYQGQVGRSQSAVARGGSACTCRE